MGACLLSSLSILFLNRFNSKYNVLCEYSHDVSCLVFLVSQADLHVWSQFSISLMLKAHILLSSAVANVHVYFVLCENNMASRESKPISMAAKSGTQSTATHNSKYFNNQTLVKVLNELGALECMHFECCYLHYFIKLFRRDSSSFCRLYCKSSSLLLIRVLILIWYC